MESLQARIEQMEAAMAELRRDRELLLRQLRLWRGSLLAVVAGGLLMLPLRSSTAQVGGYDVLGRLALLERKLARVFVSEDGRTLYIRGANLHIQNGLGRTVSGPNGLGNLIVGYNESRGEGEARTGSHNIVLGWANNYTSYSGLVMGAFNNMNAAAGIVAGFNNTVEGVFATVTGGVRNEARGPASSIHGGMDNVAEATGVCAQIGGGRENRARELNSVVVGGRANIAAAGESVVVGGEHNVTSGPKAEVQAITGSVTVTSATDPIGSVPYDAHVWALTRDTRTPVASASIGADGSYSLPVPPGNYLVFAEWFGHLRSPRQTVSVAAGQQVGGVNLGMVQGEEVNGRVMDGSTPMGDALVQATAKDGKSIGTRTLADGSYTLVLPRGEYRVTARGMTETVTVNDSPLDGVDFPAPTAGTPPAPGAIVTVAGNGILGFGGDGRRATTARQPSPQGIAVDRAGNLYISDFGTQRVRKVDAVSGIITTVAGTADFEIVRGLIAVGSTGSFSGDGGPAAQARLNFPQAVMADAAGNLYIADTANHRIRKVDGSGTISTFAGSGPTGYGVLGDFAGDGGPATAARLNAPIGLAADRAGNLYIADLSNSRIRKVDPQGVISPVVGGGTKEVTDGAKATEVMLGQPLAMAFDGNGNLYLCDPGLNRLLKVTPGGVITTVTGARPMGFSGDGGAAVDAQVAGPLGVVVDGAGVIFFSDSSNHRIRKITPDGKISTIAGSGPVFPDPGSFAGEGSDALQARLFWPFGLALDAQGNLFFSDQGNGRIRKLIGVATP